MQSLAEEKVKAAKDAGKHTSMWMEIIDPSTGRTAYYHVDKNKISFTRPRGWVKMMSTKFSKRRLQSINMNQQQVSQFVEALRVGPAEMRQHARSNSSLGSKAAFGPRRSSVSAPRRSSVLAGGGGHRRRMSRMALQSRMQAEAEVQAGHG